MFHVLCFNRDLYKYVYKYVHTAKVFHMRVHGYRYARFNHNLTITIVF